MYNRPTHLLASMCVLASHPKFNAKCLLNLACHQPLVAEEQFVVFVVLLFFGGGDGMGACEGKRHGKIDDGF